jgi:colicin import membrane protein
MKANVRVSAHHSRDLRDEGRVSLFYPVTVSLICHVVLLVIFVLAPNLNFAKPPMPSVINVSMVSFKNPAAPSGDKAVPEKKSPKVKKPAVVKKPSAAAHIKKTPAVEPPKRKKLEKAPVSLKEKTFKSTLAVRQALKKLQAEAKEESLARKEAAQQESLKSALDRLRQEVDKEEASKKAAAAKSGAKSSGEAGVKLGKFNEAGKKTAHLIDLYRIEVAYQIQKNWAFNEQLAGGDKSLAAAIVFKVLPDGEIRDIFFTDRSGNTYLDESAYRAIMKSNPVDPFPKGLSQPYIVMAIRFTPQGVR